MKTNKAKFVPNMKTMSNLGAHVPNVETSNEAKFIHLGTNL